MKLVVIFEDDPVNRPSEEYIQLQPEWQRPQLQAFTQELLERKSIDHTDARELHGDRWSLWVRREGADAVNHVCSLARADEPILSDFAKQLLSPQQGANPAQTGQRLVIVNESSTAVATGQAQEFFEPEDYALRMDQIQRTAFLKVIDDIRNGRASRDYTPGAGGVFSIHVDRAESAYGVHIHCLAKWIP